MELSRGCLGRDRIPAAALATLYAGGAVGDAEFAGLLPSAEPTDDTDTQAVLRAIGHRLGMSGTDGVPERLGPWAAVAILDITDDPEVFKDIAGRLLKDIGSGKVGRTAYYYDRYCRACIGRGMKPGALTVKKGSATSDEDDMVHYRKGANALLASARGQALTDLRGTCSRIFSY